VVTDAITGIIGRVPATAEKRAPQRWSGTDARFDRTTFVVTPEHGGEVVDQPAVASTAPSLLVAHHTPSPPTHRLLGAVRDGLSSEGLEELEVVVRPALAVTVLDVLAADGYLLGTPANFGYMSGALKHMFDTVYYPCLDATSGRPWGLWVHGNDEVEGAVRSVQRIVSGLRWTEVHQPVTVIGSPDTSADERCNELAATVAANLLL